MRPALEHGCGRQTASTSMLILHAIFHVFPISTGNGESDIDLCTLFGTWLICALFLGLAKTTRLHSGDSRSENLFGRKIRPRSPPRSCIDINTATRWRPRTQVPEKGIDLDLSLLYNLTVWTYGKIVWEHEILALAVCLLQPCSSAGRMFAASRSCLEYYRLIRSFPQKRVWCSAL